MQTRGSSVATLLLLFIYLTTDFGRANGRTIKWRRSVPSSSQHTAPKENNDNPKEVQRRSTVPVVLDLQVDQSELMVINMDDLKGVEDMKDAISAIGYEPQKVNTKKKRRSEPYSDSQLSSSYATLTASPEVDLFYYEVPKAKKTIITPQYPSKASFESVQKLNTTDLEYVYPTSPVRQTKQRFSKYQSLIPTPSEEPRSETPVIPKVLGQRRSFSPSEPPRPRPFAAPELSSPPTHNVPSTISPRRGKSRSKVRQPPVDRASSRSETSQNDEIDNYPVVDPSKTISTIRNESRRKARRLVAKPDSAQRQLAKSTTVRASREGSLEKSADGGAALTRRANNRNHWTSLKGEPNNLSEETEPSKSPITLNKRLYERKRKNQRPSVQVISNDPPVVTERTGPVEFHSFKVDTPVAYTTSRPVAREESSVRPVQFDHAPVEAARTLSATPSGLDGYQNIESPVITVPSSSLPSTIAPFTSPAPYSSNSMLYSLQTSTAGSVQDYKVSTPSPWTATLKYREVDGVADATSFRSTEVKSGEVDSKDQEGDRYQRQSDDGGSKGYSEELNSDSSEEKGDVHGTDTHVSLHKDERHPDEKGDAGHDNDAGATGSGVGDKFEKGGDEERLQGHKEEKGEKGEKGYKSRHENEKANKGHHDKETRTNYYDEKDGKEKKHDDEGGYHEERQQGEKGQKESEYDEKGDHQKGHSTKGQHTVHKKDEFEKYTEFFDDFHEDGEEEEDAEFHHDHEMKKGGSHKNSHHDFEDDEEKYGKETRFEKGKEFELTKGHKEDEGQDDYHNHEAAYGEKVSHDSKKNRAYSSGDDGNGEGGKKSH
ncbi:uncharacterized protein LOC143215621 [Lasioglossum baleicum]|uniref:uncharacterized protein LOC143215621 n=1 Tax=Lasioglossum baleicum TaxID=434251 RepID=UPI003FCDA30F